MLGPDVATPLHTIAGNVLVAEHVQPECPPRHQQVGIERDVCVKGEGRDGEAVICTLCMYVYRLSAHQGDDQIAVRSQYLDRVEQRFPGFYVVSVKGSFHMSSWSRIHSRRASAGPVMRSSRTWVTRAKAA